MIHHHLSVRVDLKGSQHTLTSYVKLTEHIIQVSIIHVFFSKLLFKKCISHFFSVAIFQLVSLL